MKIISSLIIIFLISCSSSKKDMNLYTLYLNDNAYSSHKNYISNTKDVFILIENQKLSILKKSLKKVPVNIIDPQTGDTLLIRAVKYNRLALCHYLLKRKADKYIKNFNGETAYSIAKDKGLKKIMSLLGRKSKKS